MNILHDRATAFLAALSRKSATEWHDAFLGEVQETFGQITAPHGECSHLWDITLHGITAQGGSEAEAFANWQRIARATLATPPQEFGAAA